MDGPESSMSVAKLEDNSFSSIYRNEEIKAIKDDMIIQNSLIVHNKKLTFMRQGLNFCIDHIISNCYAKITNVHMLNGEEINNGKIF